MSTDLPEIRQRISVDDSALGKLGGRFRGIAGTLGKAVAGGAAVAAAGLGAFVVQGVRGAIEVDRGLREVVTLFGETGEAAEALFGDMQAGVAGLSSEIGIAQDVLTSGLYSAISAGVPQDNVFDFLEVAGRAAIGGVTDVETAVDGLTTVINAWGLETDQAEEVADSLFTAVKGGKTTFEELSASLFQVAPSAAAAGIGFGEVNAAVATLTAAGTPTAVATTQIRQAINELNNPTAAAAKAFEEIAGVTFRDFIAAGGDMQGALAILADEADKTGAQVGDYFGSVEASSAATALASTNAEKFAEELANQADAAGASGMAFDEMEKSTGRQMEKLRTNLANVGIEVGARLLPHLNTIIEWATRNLPPAIEAVVGAFGAVMGAIRPVIDTVRSLVERFRGGSSDMVESTEGVRAFLADAWESIRGIFDAAATIITAIVRGVTAVISGVWERAGGRIVEFVQRAMTNLMEIIGGALEVIRGIFDVFAGLFTGDWSRMGDGLKAIVSGLWRVIKGIINQALNAIGAIFRVGLALIQTLWSGLWNRTLGIIRSASASIRAAVSGAISSVVATVRGLPGRILSALGNLSNLLRQAGRNLILGLINGIKSMASAPVDAVRGIVSRVRNLLPFSPAKEGPLSGKGSPERAGATIGAMLADGLRASVGTVADAAGQVAGAARPRAGVDPFGIGTSGAAGQTGGAGRAGVDQTFHVRAFDVREAARELSDEMAYAGALLTAPRG